MEGRLEQWAESGTAMQARGDWVSQSQKSQAPETYDGEEAYERSAPTRVGREKHEEGDQEMGQASDVSPTRVLSMTE